MLLDPVAAVAAAAGVAPDWGKPLIAIAVAPGSVVVDVRGSVVVVAPGSVVVVAAGSVVGVVVDEPVPFGVGPGGSVDVIGLVVVVVESVVVVAGSVVGGRRFRRGGRRGASSVPSRWSRLPVPLWSSSSSMWWTSSTWSTWWWSRRRDTRWVRLGLALVERDHQRAALSISEIGTDLDVAERDRIHAHGDRILPRLQPLIDTRSANELADEHLPARRGRRDTGRRRIARLSRGAGRRRRNRRRRGAGRRRRNRRGRRGRRCGRTVVVAVLAVAVLVIAVLVIAMLVIAMLVIAMLTAAMLTAAC